VLVLGYLPWQLRKIDSIAGAYLQTLFTYGGLLVFAAGAVTLFAGAHYLARRGDGTPLPLDPPKRMVVAGPYAYIQHPMSLGLVLMAFGEALWFYSPSLGVYAFCLVFLLNLFVIYIEEPYLEKCFGEDYRAYRAVTPRWLPFGR
ncbi:MAG: methyltransferase family protein, partial [Terriglobia bacterium]